MKSIKRGDDITMEKILHKTTDNFTHYVTNAYKSCIRLYYKYKRSKYKQVLSGLFFGILALFFIKSGIVLVFTNNINMHEIIFSLVGSMISFTLGLISMLKTKPKALNPPCIIDLKEKNAREAA